MIIKETMAVVEKIIKIKKNVLIILTKEIFHTTRSGTTIRQQNESKCLQNKPTKKKMKINVTGVV
jgi:hypothetical protein